MQLYWERLFSQDTAYFTLLIVLAILTQHLVSWAGSVLNSVASEEYHYAVFTFKDDRNLPMTTNILMNVCIPNVFMVFLFMASKKLGIEGAEHRLYLYVVAFYVYRMFLICVLLRRKEMYHWPYELAMAAAGSLLALWLCRSFFVTEKTVFLEISELREELWIAILLVLYQFVKLILDKKVTQNTVLTKGQITRYITRKFDRFFQRYGELLEITAQNRYLCVFLFAVMIFEDYNRGPIVRRIERIKARFCKQTTTGIMQMRGDDGPLSDQESVLLFYRWLEQSGVDNAHLDSDEVHDLAWQYNNDDDYANSVAYIYEKLCEYIDEVPRYRKCFFFR